MKKETNWEEIENKIKNLKFPLSFIFNLFKNSKYFLDYDLSLIIRYYLKNHFNVAFNFYLLKIVNLINDKNISKKILHQFYFNLRKKFIIYKFLNNFIEVYKKKKQLINKNIYLQLLEIKKLRDIFLSNFDSCKSNNPIHHKLLPILTFKKNFDKKFIIYHLIERLRNVFLLFGNHFFDKYKIIKIKKSKFLNMKDKDKIKYCTYIFQKIKNILNKVINSLEILRYTNNQIINIINPIPIKIEINNSESDNDELLFLIEN